MIVSCLVTCFAQEYEIMEYDAIIIGAGIAGCNLALDLHVRGQKVLLIDSPNMNRCSRVAAGLMNPIVPRGVRPTWMRDEIFGKLEEYYSEKEEITNSTFFRPLPMHQYISKSNPFEWTKAVQKLKNIDWIEALDSKKSDFLAFNLKKIYQLDTEKYCETTKRFFKQGDSFIELEVDYHSLVFEKEYWTLEGNIRAKSVIFCDGYGVINNPFFKNLPIIPCTGLISKYQINHNLADKTVIKFKKWAIPDKGGDYLVGSTFTANSTDTKVNLDEREELEANLKVWSDSYQLVSENKGIRPTVSDRRPIIGEHPEIKGLYIFNGLGSKGCSLSIIASPALSEFIINRTELPAEMDVKRFF